MNLETKKNISRRIATAKLYIDENYLCDINLDHVALAACISKFHFIRLFKNAYGRTPHQYLSYRRIETAKKMLSKKNIKVSAVAEEIGFESTSAFCKLFKQYTGVSPLQYKTQKQRDRKVSREEPLAFIPGCYSLVHGLTEKQF